MTTKLSQRNIEKVQEKNQEGKREGGKRLYLVLLTLTNVILGLTKRWVLTLKRLKTPALSNLIAQVFNIQ